MRGSRARRIDRANPFLPIPASRNASSAIFLAFNPRIMPVQGGMGGGRGGGLFGVAGGREIFHFSGEAFPIVARKEERDSRFEPSKRIY